jgi:hypothetical protein
LRKAARRFFYILDVPMKRQFVTDTAKQRGFDPSRLNAQILERAMQEMIKVTIERVNGELAIRIPPGFVDVSRAYVGQTVSMWAEHDGSLAVRVGADELTLEAMLATFDHEQFGDDDWESWRPEDVARRGL